MEEDMSNWEEAKVDYREAEARLKPARESETTKMKEENLYDVHRRLVAQWRKSCEEAAAAQCRMAQAKDELDRVSKQFFGYLQQQMTDPTIPQASEVTNGRAEQAGMQTPSNWPGYRDR